MESRSSTSVADFFNSFETHLRPVLLSVAALHRIEVPSKSEVEAIRKLITTHILSGHCTQFLHSHPPISVPLDLSLPDCADVCNEWEEDSVDQVHILTAICGSKTSPNAMRQILNTLNIQHDPVDSLRPTANNFIYSVLIALDGVCDIDQAEEDKADPVNALPSNKLAVAYVLCQKFKVNGSTGREDGDKTQPAGLISLRLLPLYEVRSFVGSFHFLVAKFVCYLETLRQSFPQPASLCEEF